MIRSLAFVAALAAAAGLAAWPQSGRAQAFVSGAQLTKACSGRLPADLFSCDGYIAGTLDYVRETPELKDKVCPPSGTKLAALREALGRYGQQRPSEANGPGVALVVSFIKTTYPCPAK